MVCGHVGGLRVCGGGGGAWEVSGQECVVGRYAGVVVVARVWGEVGGRADFGVGCVSCLHRTHGCM